MVEEPRARRGFGSLKSVAMAGIVAAVLVLFVIPYWYTANPASCTRCHEMKKYYDNWKESNHSTAAKNCFYCHVRPGFFNLSYYRITFYREIYASVAGQKLKPTGATIPGTDSCRQCHSLNREYGSSGEIRISHRHHVLKAKVGCPDCHPGASHGTPRPARKICKGCHREVMSNCRMCHKKRITGDFKH